MTRKFTKRAPMSSTNVIQNSNVAHARETLWFPTKITSIFNDENAYFWENKILAFNVKIRHNIFRQYGELEKQRERDDIEEYMEECYLTQQGGYGSDFELHSDQDSYYDYDSNSCGY